jgi:hypothetical protein
MVGFHVIVLLAQPQENSEVFKANSTQREIGQTIRPICDIEEGIAAKVLG